MMQRPLSSQHFWGNARDIPMFQKDSHRNAKEQFELGHSPMLGLNTSIRSEGLSNTAMMQQFMHLIAAIAALM